MKTKAGLSTMAAKNQARNGLRFVFNCIGWNLDRMIYLSMEPDPWDRWLYETSNKSKNSDISSFKAD